MTVADLYDVRRTGTWKCAGKAHDGALLVRIDARKNMTPSQKAVDDLLQLPDLGERICMGIARVRPELYVWERERLWEEVL